ncbi:MAG: tRNA preQ1(34) S-adenosylmethionine ribosyltransferase-isomerase QueA [Patescibacteria group bacterium]|jgi:S-adenosylmethionine:tRNA ribosyltransferase-isomerase
MSYELQAFNYHLPQELIGQEPAKPRDAARLLVLNRQTQEIQESNFKCLADFLQPGDVLIINDSKVLPARLLGKKESGGQVEILLHRLEKANVWECLVGGRVRPAMKVFFKKGLVATLINDQGDGTWRVSFNQSGAKFIKTVSVIGLMPLPPYIKNARQKLRVNKKRYQTVYAAANKVGSVAAPTAGLHFTPRLFRSLKKRGVVVKKITLHVGLGTFATVKESDIRNHQMHAEWAVIDKKTATYLRSAKQVGRRLVAVGTTSARTLETWAQAGWPEELGVWTKIFIYPGYNFLAVDALITNFHLPQSTLLMMVSAFAGEDLTKKAYQLAVENRYKFYSFGDGMLIV